MLAVLFFLGFRVPKDAARNSLGYAYTLDEESFCTHLRSAKQCEKDYAGDKDQCLTALSNPEVCINSLDTWLDSLNWTCHSHIDTFNKCTHAAQSPEQEQTECAGAFTAMLECASKMNREPWMPLPDFRQGMRKKVLVSSKETTA